MANEQNERFAGPNPSVNHNLQATGDASGRDPRHGTTETEAGTTNGLRDATGARGGIQESTNSQGHDNGRAGAGDQMSRCDHKIDFLKRRSIGRFTITGHEGNKTYCAKEVCNHRPDGRKVRFNGWNSFAYSGIQYEDAYEPTRPTGYDEPSSDDEAELDTHSAPAEDMVLPSVEDDKKE